MNEQDKMDLVLKNKRGEKYRKQKTAKAIGEVYSLSKEIGILGDAVEYLFELVSQLHEGVTVDPAFLEWRSKVAEIKEAIKRDFAQGGEINEG